MVIYDIISYIASLNLLKYLMPYRSMILLILFVSTRSKFDDLTKASWFGGSHDSENVIRKVFGILIIASHVQQSHDWQGTKLGRHFYRQCRLFHYLYVPLSITWLHPSNPPHHHLYPRPRYRPRHDVCGSTRNCIHSSDTLVSHRVWYWPGRRPTCVRYGCYSRMHG